MNRHVGPKDEDIQVMLQQVGFKSLAELVDSAIPQNIRLKRELALEESLSETEALQKLKDIVGKNKVGENIFHDFFTSANSLCALICVRSNYSRC